MGRSKKVAKTAIVKRRVSTNRSPAAYAKVDELIDLRLELDQYENLVSDTRERMKVWAEEARMMGVAPAVLVEKMGVSPTTAHRYLNPKPLKS